jgi:hypothetical protein
VAASTSTEVMKLRVKQRNGVHVHHVLVQQQLNNLGVAHLQQASVVNRSLSGGLVHAG